MVDTLGSAQTLQQGIMQVDFCSRSLSKIVIPRLFHHTFGTHTKQPVPTGYKPGFLS